MIQVFHSLSRLCNIFWALINSLICWFFIITLLNITTDRCWCVFHAPNPSCLFWLPADVGNKSECIQWQIAVWFGFISLMFCLDTVWIINYWVNRKTVVNTNTVTASHLEVRYIQNCDNANTVTLTASHLDLKVRYIYIQNCDIFFFLSLLKLILTTELIKNKIHSQWVTGKTCKQ